MTRTKIPQLPDLPVMEAVPQLLAALHAGRAVILEAPPGAGKSTLVPLTLLQSSWLSDGKIVMLEPRRLAARAVANRMAALLGQPVGQSVGFRTRLETRVSRETRIEVITEGILTRMLQSDPGLAGVNCVMEFRRVLFRSSHRAGQVSLNSSRPLRTLRCEGTIY